MAVADEGVMDTQIIAQLRDGSLGHEAPIKSSLSETLALCPLSEKRLVFTYLARNGEGNPVVPKGELIMNEGRFAFYRRLVDTNQITDLKAHSVSESTKLR